MKKSFYLTAALIVCLVLLGVSALLLFNRSAGLTYADANRYTAGDTAVSETVEHLEVRWTSGRVRIEYHDGSDILVAETSDKAIPDDMRLRWWLDGTTLRIRYAKEGFRLGSLFGSQPQKTLTVTLPKELVLQSADIGATSADLDLNDLAAERISLASTSGDIAGSVRAAALNVGSTSGDQELRVTGNTAAAFSSTSGSVGISMPDAGSVTASSTSGGVSLALDGSADSIRLSSTSGGISAAFAAADRAEFSSTSGNVTVRAGAFGNLNVGSTSGSVTAFLPAAPGFTCRVETASGSFSSALPLAGDRNTYTCGDGSARCVLHTTSGDIRVEEYR